MNNSPKPISLIGYMTSGKSAVGRALSEELNLPFYDLDTEIEKDLNGSITTIFNEKGEVYFRKIEHEKLQEILTQTREIIVATGGGTPLYYNNMEIIQSQSISFYLQASVKVLSKRIWAEKSTRPLVAHLEDKEIPEFVAKHLFEREKTYRKAQYSIPIEGKSIKEITQEITHHIPPHP